MLRDSSVYLSSRERTGTHLLTGKASGPSLGQRARPRHCGHVTNPALVTSRRHPRHRVWEQGSSFGTLSPSAAYDSRQTAHPIMAWDCCSCFFTVKQS